MPNLWTTISRLKKALNKRKMIELSFFRVLLSGLIPNQVELAIRTRNPVKVGFAKAFDAGNILHPPNTTQRSIAGQPCMMDVSNSN